MSAIKNAQQSVPKEPGCYAPDAGEVKRQCAFTGRCSPEAHSPDLRQSQAVSCALAFFPGLSVQDRLAGRLRQVRMTGRVSRRDHMGQAANRWVAVDGIISYKPITTSRVFI